MPLLEAVGKAILPGNCQDQNQNRKFVSLLWHRIAASLFLPPKETVRLSKEELQQIIELFKHDSEQQLPDTYTIYRYEEQPA
jgi:hypothetical protein